MFKNEYQGGPYFEVFSAHGKDSITKWKVNGSTGISKSYDKDVKSYIYVLEGSSATTRIQLPKDNKQLLTLIQRYLVLQLYVPLGQEFSIELGVSDLGNNKRRMLLSTSQKEIICTPLHARISLALMKRGIWLNLCLDMVSLVGENWKGQTFRALENLIISANCRLRRIFTMRSQPPDTTDDDELYRCGDTNQGDLSCIPKSCTLAPDLPHLTQIINMYKIRCAEVKGRSDVIAKPAALVDIDSIRHKISQGSGSAGSRKSNSSTASSKDSSSTSQRKSHPSNIISSGEGDSLKSSSSVEMTSSTRKGPNKKSLLSKEKSERHRNKLHRKYLNRDQRFVRRTGSIDNVARLSCEKIVTSASSDSIAKLRIEQDFGPLISIADHDSENTQEKQHSLGNLNILKGDSELSKSHSEPDVERAVQKELSVMNLVNISLSDLSKDEGRLSHRTVNDSHHRLTNISQKQNDFYLSLDNNSTNNDDNLSDSFERSTSFPLLNLLKNVNQNNEEANGVGFLNDWEGSHLPATDMRATFKISDNISGQKKIARSSVSKTVKSFEKRQSLEYEESDSDDFSKIENSIENKVYLFASPPKFAPRRNVSPMNVESCNDQSAKTSKPSKIENERGPRPEEDFIHSSSSDDYDEDIKQNLMWNSSYSNQSISESSGQTKLSIGGGSLREIPSNDKRLSSGVAKDQPNKYSMEELSESCEAQMLASLKRQQVEELNLSRASNRGSLEKHVYGDDSLSSSSDDTTLSTWRASVPPLSSQHYQTEMRLSAIKSTPDPLSMSNPRDWAGVFSPPITAPPRCESDDPSELLNIIDQKSLFLDPDKKPDEIVPKTGEPGEEELDLLYDPCLNCYFDPKSCKYYELI